MDKDTTKSTINELLKLLDEKTFLKLLNVTNLDYYVKKLTAYKFLQLFIIAQWNETESLKLIAKELKNTEELQVFLKMDAISKSQLSRKQSGLPPKVFETVFHHLVQSIQTNMKHSTPILRNITKLLVIDSSTMSMSLSQYPWATFRKTKQRLAFDFTYVLLSQKNSRSQIRQSFYPQSTQTVHKWMHLWKSNQMPFTYLTVDTLTISNMTNFVFMVFPSLHVSRKMQKSKY